MQMNMMKTESITLHQWQLFHIQKGLDQAERGEFASEEEVEKVFWLLKTTHKKSAVQELIDVLDGAGDKVKEMNDKDVMKLVSQEVKTLRKREH